MSTKFAGPLAHLVLDLRQGPLSLPCLFTPVPPQWTSGSQSPHVDEGYGLRWATLEITDFISVLQPNGPDENIRHD